jgi:hypothetical protein
LGRKRAAVADILASDLDCTIEGTIDSEAEDEVDAVDCVSILVANPAWRASLFFCHS